MTRVGNLKGSLGRIVAGAALLTSCSLGPLDAQVRELSFDELKSELEYVLELVAKRQLSDEELRRAAGEFYGLLGNHCGARCIEAVEMNKGLVEPMAKQPGSPRDLLARQWLSHNLYFSPEQSGSFIQSLADEADPIRLADAKSGRVMTREDVRGLMNINQFLHGGGEPRQRSPAAAEIENLVSAFRQRFVEGQLSLPYRGTLAAELWAGLEQNWGKLSGDQKSAVRAYLSDKEFRTELDVSTYQALLGLSSDEALTFQRDNKTAQQNARLEWITLKTLLVSEAATNVQVSGSYCYFCR